MQNVDVRWTWTAVVAALYQGLSLPVPALMPNSGNIHACYLLGHLTKNKTIPNFPNASSTKTNITTPLNGTTMLVVQRCARACPAHHKTYTLPLSSVGSTGLPTTTWLFVLGAEVEDGFLHRYTKKTTIATSKRPKGIPKPKPKARGR